MDDILFTSSSSLLIHKLIDSLHAKFTLKKLGSPKYFLGIELKCLASGNLLLTQYKYLRDLLAKANMSNANGVTTPMFNTCTLNKNGSFSLPDPFMYRSMVGVL